MDYILLAHAILDGGYTGTAAEIAASFAGNIQIQDTTIYTYDDVYALLQNKGYNQTNLDTLITQFKSIPGASILVTTFQSIGGINLSNDFIQSILYSFINASGIDDDVRTLLRVVANIGIKTMTIWSSVGLEGAPTVEDVMIALDHADVFQYVHQVTNTVFTDDNIINMSLTDMVDQVTAIGDALEAIASER